MHIESDVSIIRIFMIRFIGIAGRTILTTVTVIILLFRIRGIVDGGLPILHGVATGETIILITTMVVIIRHIMEVTILHTGEVDILPHIGEVDTTLIIIRIILITMQTLVITVTESVDLPDRLLLEMIEVIRDRIFLPVIVQEQI